MASSRTRWWIYRFELAYFNPRYQRWALFQENPAIFTLAEHPMTELARHRVQVQAVLKSVRSAFQSIPRGTRFGVRPLPEITKKPLPLVFGPPSIAHRISSSFGPDPKNTWQPILAEYSRLLADEGVSATSPDLPQLFAELANWTAFTAPYPEWRKDITPLSALQLLSILPILPHWDLWGIFHADLRWSTTPITAAVPCASRAPVPTLLHLAAQLDQPFYAAHLKYPRDQHPASSPECRDVPPSVELLGYEVRLAVTYCDLCSTSPCGTNVIEDDYYRYCFNPKGHDQEELPYLVYAYLIDHLQKAIPGQRPGEEAQDVYYFSYPVFTPLGRKHFLDVYVYPEEPEASLDDLWEAWQQLHPLLGWDHLRLLLSDELEEIDIGYAQALLSRDIREAMEKPDYKPGTALPLPRMVCRYGHVLFPAVAFRAPAISAAESFHYGSKMVRQFDFGKDWIPNGSPEGEVSFRRLATGVGEVEYAPDVLVSGERASAVLHAVASARRDRLVEEQLELAHRLWQAGETGRRAEEARMQCCRDELRRQFLDKTVSEQTDIWGAVIAARNADETVPAYGQSLRVLLRDCVPRQAADNDILRAAGEVFAWSYTLLASEYFGRGPIKELTHGVQYYIAETVDQLRTDCQTAYKIACPAFQLWPQYASDCRTFHEQAITEIEKLNSPTNNYLKELEDLRDQKHKFPLTWCGSGYVPTPQAPGVPFGSELASAGGDVVELYLPVHVILASSFQNLSQLWNQQVVGRATGSRLAFALDLYSAAASDRYPGGKEPKYRRNYFSWSYQGEWTLDQLRAHCPEKVSAVLGDENLRKCGMLWVGFKSEDNVSWAQYRPIEATYNANNWREMYQSRLFPADVKSELMNLIFQNAQKSCAWLLTFDSWYQG